VLGVTVHNSGKVFRGQADICDYWKATETLASCVMPRSIQIEFAGVIYHVMARCNRRENIFMDDEDRRTFLRSLAEVKPLHQRVQNMVQTVTNVSLPPFLLFPKLQKVLKMLAFGWIFCHFHFPF